MVSTASVRFGEYIFIPQYTPDKARLPYKAEAVSKYRPALYTALANKALTMPLGEWPENQNLGAFVATDADTYTTLKVLKTLADKESSETNPQDKIATTTYNLFLAAKQNGARLLVPRNQPIIPAE